MSPWKIKPVKYKNRIQIKYAVYRDGDKYIIGIANTQELLVERLNDMIIELREQEQIAPAFLGLEIEQNVV